MNQLFTRIAGAISLYAGKAVTFLLAIVIIVVWAGTGPMFGFSDTWQLVVNTGTTIKTFLMVFLIQNTQNRDSAAVQVKLDELLRAVKDARDIKFVGMEHLTDEEIDELRQEVEETAQKNGRSTASKAKKRGTTKEGGSSKSGATAATAG